MSKKKKEQKSSQPQTAIVIDIPQSDLMTLIKDGGCADEIENVAEEIKKKSPQKAKSYKCAAKILRTIEYVWKEILKEYADATALPKDFVPEGFVLTNKDERKKTCKCAKKAKNTDKGKTCLSCGKTKKKEAVKITVRKTPSLTEAEKKVVAHLRSKGFSIKRIGKEIHRAEKAVADYVRTLPSAK